VHEPLHLSARRPRRCMLHPTTSTPALPAPLHVFSMGSHFFLTFHTDTSPVQLTVYIRSNRPDVSGSPQSYTEHHHTYLIRKLYLGTKGLGRASHADRLCDKERGPTVVTDQATAMRPSRRLVSTSQ